MRLIEIPDDGIVREMIMCGNDAVGERRVDLSHLPTIDPASLRSKGEWIEKKEWHHGRWVAWHECSRCGERDDNYEMYEMMPFCRLPKFCPECGADMRGENK